jgi:hypothetical protein
MTLDAAIKRALGAANPQSRLAVYFILDWPSCICNSLSRPQSQVSAFKDNGTAVLVV